MNAMAGPVGGISPEDYLDGERASEIRHEYMDGYVYAMAGASDDHNRITRNILTALDNALRGQRCEPFSTDMKVKIPSAFTDGFYYPDVLVTGDPADNARYFRERPSIIFEVISPETERTDRRETAVAYRQIPTMDTYILVEQDRMAVTILRRADPGWKSETLEGLAAILKLEAIGVELPLARIYERTAVATGKQGGS
jgi:Uma2 family endonuclease